MQSAFFIWASAAFLRRPHLRHVPNMGGEYGKVDGWQPPGPPTPPPPMHQTNWGGRFPSDRLGRAPEASLYEGEDKSNKKTVGAVMASADGRELNWLGVELLGRCRQNGVGAGLDRARSVP